VLAPGLLELVDAEEDRDPAVSNFSGDLDRTAADRSDEDRDLVALGMEVKLERLALAVGKRQLVVLALEVELLLAGDDAAHDLDVKRPPESLSIVAPAIAAAAGGRAGTCMIAAPRLIFSVCPASQARTLTQSEP